MSEQFKHYRIITEVGAGGLGKVYKAVDDRNGQIVAIKMLHEKYQKSKKFLGIFYRELLILSRLRNKHIVNFIDANFAPPNCYIVTEFIDGWSLHQLIKYYHNIPPLVALSIGIAILQGIDHLHLHDMVHSDLSSPNVLIDRSGRVVVTDFGLAFQEQVEDYRNYIVGTPGYYSPEHITNSALVPQSDIYCVGLLLFEMISGTKAIAPQKHRRRLVRNMKRIDFNQISSQIDQFFLRRSVLKILKSSLHIRVKGRVKYAETLILLIHKVLKKHNIESPRQCILQFLNDGNLVAKPDQFTQQDIYIGYRRRNSS